MMTVMDLSPQRLAALLEPVLSIARAAGREIMTHYAGETAVTHKADDSPLTAADLAAQRVILSGLVALEPRLPVLSEESPTAELEHRRDWQALWLVDPLDGTREFLKRNGEFTVNIALVHEHQPVLGVVSAPALGLDYYGARGVGAWHTQGGGAPQPLTPTRTAAARPRVLGSRSHRGASLDALLERLGDHELVAVGSALKFGWLAEGRADFYPRLSPTSEWDTGAGQAVLEAAGCHVVGLDGAPLRYNARDTLLNPSFLCWADDSRDWRALALAQP
jgi:3'(2'), 5'-bisphosphate nucleotidase